MCTENLAHYNFPTKLAATQTTSPFSTSGLIVESNTICSRPASPAMPLNTMPFPLSSSPTVTSGCRGFRLVLLGRFSDSSIIPPPYQMSQQLLDISSVF